jgi:hypothetical protein
MGERHHGLELYAQALVIQREVGDRHGEATTLWNMALEQYKLGERARALANGDAALKIAETYHERKAAQIRARLEEWRKTT